jgi:ankyrin repeat protein
MVAVKNKCQDAIMRLLENPTSKTSSAENNYFGSALAVASTLASQFIEHQLNDRLHKNPERDKSQTPLFPWAVQCGHVAVVQLLLEKGISTKLKSQDRLTALHLAAESGHETVVQLLLEKGADVEAKGQDGRTALHRAAGRGHKAVVQLLLEKGADVEAKDHDGRTALHLAARSGHEAVVRLLESKIKQG